MPVRARSRRRRAAADAPAERPPVHVLFAYGTLTDPRFVARLLERPVAARDAELLDFEWLEPEGFGYPAVFARAGSRVAGRLYRGLSESDFERIDSYQGVSEDLYFRDLARVVAPGAEPGAGEDAWVYLPTGRTVRQFSRPHRDAR